MNVAILIASYYKDFDYLEWCLKSIDKFAKGFSQVVIALPDDDLDVLIERQFPYLFTVRTYIRTPDKSKWQIQAQAHKCMADIYCPQADFILHMDSDCIFTEPVTPADYFKDGKPVMLIENYNRLKDSPWKAITEQVLRERIQYETMRRHPQVNPKGIYPEFRNYLSVVHHMDFEDYVLSCRGEFPPGFSEHNAIGAYALGREPWRSAYSWIEVGKDPVPKEKLRQWWSYSPIDKPQNTPHDHDHVTPLQICQKIVG